MENLSDRALDGYAKQYEFYKERIAKEGRETALTFEEYVEIKEKFKNYAVEEWETWWME